MPDKRRAINIPSRLPAVTIDRADARLCGGARSPTSGSMSCGVTVVIAVIKDIAQNTSKLLVRHKPILLVVSKCHESTGPGDHTIMLP